MTRRVVTRRKNRFRVARDGRDCSLRTAKPPDCARRVASWPSGRESRPQIRTARRRPIRPPLHHDRDGERPERIAAPGASRLGLGALRLCREPSGQSCPRADLPRRNGRRARRFPGCLAKPYRHHDSLWRFPSPYGNRALCPLPAAQPAHAGLGMGAIRRGPAGPALADRAYPRHPRPQRALRSGRQLRLCSAGHLGLAAHERGSTASRHDPGLAAWLHRPAFLAATAPELRPLGGHRLRLRVAAAGPCSSWLRRRRARGRGPRRKPDLVVRYPNRYRRPRCCGGGEDQRPRRQSDPRLYPPRRRGPRRACTPAVVATPQGCGAGELSGRAVDRDRARHHGVGSEPGGRHRPCLGLRRPRALFDLPHPNQPRVGRPARGQ